MRAEALRDQMHGVPGGCRLKFAEKRGIIPIPRPGCLGGATEAFFLIDYIKEDSWASMPALHGFLQGDGCIKRLQSRRWNTELLSLLQNGSVKDQTQGWQNVCVKQTNQC